MNTHPDSSFADSHLTSHGRPRRRTALLLCVCAVCAAPLAPGADAPPETGRFEVAAWVDHFDFAGIERNNAYLFDSETAEGCAAILDHVLETGATSIWWRNCAGATMRYPSRVDSHHHDTLIDKRRLPDNRPVYGWVHYGAAEPDIIATIMTVCRNRGLEAGIHWPFEENHWSSWTLGGWNLDHPQYWCRDPHGTPWAGRASIAYSDVVEHKLALIDELIERGMDTLFIDTWRSGGWSPAMEYVPPVVAAWTETHKAQPPENPRDPAWCAHVATYVTDFMVRIRERLDASGRNIRFVLGVFAPLDAAHGPLIERGIDWRGLVSRGVLDGLVINAVRWDNDAPFDSTAQRYSQVIQAVDGRCRVLCPVRAYDYSGFGMPSYAKATGLPQPEIAEKLIRLAWECGADGISLECVDYNNYTPETRRIMQALTRGECRLKKRGKAENAP
jgi:hypothetical protein